MAMCSCESGLYRHALYDARGIFCTYVCDDCEQRKMERYDPRIFAGLYEADEPIEEDY